MLDVTLRRRLGQFELNAAFRCPVNGITALFGASGCGKTMIVNAIAGMMRPDAGHVRLGALTFFDSRAGVDEPPQRRRIGYVFQDTRLFPHMSVARNLLYGWRRAPAADRRIDADHVIELLGLRSLLDRRPHTLSGGEKQRVGLGRALLAQPRLLLMDEPLAALDAKRKAEILPYIERLRDDVGIPMVYVSHSLEEVIRLAGTLVVLDRGRVAAVGDVVDIMARLDLHPLTGRYEGGAVIETRVAGHDDAYALTKLAFDGGELVVPRVEVPIGQRLRARVRARDVLIALEKPQGLSALNVLEGTVADLRREEGAYAEIQIAMGAARLLARITRQSSERLGLVRGKAVYAVIKSVAIDRRSLNLPFSASVDE